MNHIKKMMSHLLVLGLLSGTALISGFSYTKSNQNQVNNHLTRRGPSISRISEGDFSDETDVADLRLPGEEDTEDRLLRVSINASNITETSECIDVTFRSRTSLGFKEVRQQNFLVTVNDPNFRGKNDPAPEGYERMETVTIEETDPETGETVEKEIELPVFDGAICYITNGGKKDVYLPYKFTFDKNFIIEVKGLSAHCTTADGEEYDGANAWGKVKNIYIPKEYTTAEIGTFTGVPDDVKIYYEGEALPEGFAAGWVDKDSAVVLDPDSYPVPESKEDIDWRTDQHTSGWVTDLVESPSFIIGCSNTTDPEHTAEDLNKPLTLQYDVKKKDGSVVTKFMELGLTNTIDSYYDACGDIRSSNYSRTINFRFENDEVEIIDSSFKFHNIMQVVKDSTLPDTSKRYYAIPEISYGGKEHKKQPLSDLVTYKKGSNSVFAGYSLFSLTMDKNLSVTSEAYPEPHSAYLDIATNYYLQNESKIKSGVTKIRYTLYNLYNTKAHLVYKSKGELKDAFVPIKTDITLQILEKNKGNKVAVLFNNAFDAEGVKLNDFSAEKVVSFELMDVTVRMDLVTTNEAGSVSNLGKTFVQFKFGYITVFENGKANPFNWNIFLIIFFVAYAGLFAAGAYVLYRIQKEKFKNDEFRRVNDKKFLKTAAIDGVGFGIILAAVLFIIMRAAGFRNTIAVFNPTDPLLIGFSIVGMIILGYFIVSLVKRVKAEQERRKIIRLKLDQDEVDDGTN